MRGCKNSTVCLGCAFSSELVAVLFGKVVNVLEQPAKLIPTLHLPSPAPALDSMATFILHDMTQK